MEFGEKGEFNSGIAIVYRLDAIHKAIHIARVKKEFEALYQANICLYMEVTRIPYEGEDEEKKREDIKLVNELWDKAKDSYFKYLDCLNHGSPFDYKNFEILYKWEIELTKLEQKYGQGMGKKEDARMAMGKR